MIFYGSSLAYDKVGVHHQTRAFSREYGVLHGRLAVLHSSIEHSSIKLGFFCQALYCRRDWPRRSCAAARGNSSSNLLCLSFINTFLKRDAVM